MKGRGVTFVADRVVEGSSKVGFILKLVSLSRPFSTEQFIFVGSCLFQVALQICELLFVGLSKVDSWAGECCAGTLAGPKEVCRCWE